jgi:hypothetical protein
VINPTDADIGREVTYKARHKGAKIEDGVITSFNDTYVFVRYRDQYPAAWGKATSREDLEWGDK